MSEFEIELARAYLGAADQDPVGALLRSVKDLARARRLLASVEQGPRTPPYGGPSAAGRRMLARPAACAP